MKTKIVRDNDRPKSTVHIDVAGRENRVALWIDQCGDLAAAHLTTGQARKVVKHLKRAIKECK